MPEHSIVILCSNWNFLNQVVCDKPLGHKGPHQALIVWGDEAYAEDEDD